MPTEYVIQKRGLQVWQYVTWYSDKEQALENFRKLKAGEGYSYRLVALEVLDQSLLEGEFKDVPPNVEAVEAVKSSGWGNGWTTNKDEEIKPTGKGVHLVGRIWMANKTLKQKRRVEPSEVDGLLAQGWFKAGPRTII